MGETQVSRNHLIDHLDIPNKYLFEKWKGSAVNL